MTKKINRIESIKLSLGPLYLELSLAHAIADPPETHIRSFGVFGFYGVVGDAGGGGVVAVDNSGGLRPAQFFNVLGVPRLKD